MSAGIKSLTIKGFKGFGNEITIDFTRNAKNLVIYGENGSGKTSIMEALKLLFDSSTEKIELEKYKNIFLENGIEISIKTMEGKSISLKDAPEDYKDDVRTYLEAISRSTTILSYRKLMKIYDIQTDGDFYDLFIRNIMAYYSIPPSYQKTLIELIKEYEDLRELREKDARKVKTEKLNAKEREVLNEINKIFSEIKDKWNEYIKTLTGDDIEVECSIEQLGSLNFKIKWIGKDVRNIINYLNEGRLNAVALGLFLAYYKKFNTSPYKLLLLDDVVIGLDMSLRLPLLEILQKDFEGEYQIIITTFDENWFNLMKNYLGKEKWKFIRLYTRHTDNEKFPFIIGVESSDYLEKAKYYSENGDIPAAALYTRLEFERIVSKYAEKKKLPIKFRRKASDIPISEIWSAVSQDIPRSRTLCKRVDIYKSILLNPSVHYDQKPKYRKEIKYAIAVVSQLKKIIDKELARR